jgi:hypothetical protein
MSAPEPDVLARRPGLRHVVWVLWPSFLLAGVTETLVFAVFDPNDMALWGGEPLHWSRQAVYTVSFFMFWALCTASSAFTLFLSLSPAADAAPEARPRVHTDRNHTAPGA